MLYVCPTADFICHRAPSLCVPVFVDPILYTCVSVWGLITLQECAGQEVDFENPGENGEKKGSIDVLVLKLSIQELVQKKAGGKY